MRTTIGVIMEQVMEHDESKAEEALELVDAPVDAVKLFNITFPDKLAVHAGGDKVTVLDRE